MWEIQNAWIVESELLKKLKIINRIIWRRQLYIYNSWNLHKVLSFLCFKKSYYWVKIFSILLSRDINSNTHIITICTELQKNIYIYIFHTQFRSICSSKFYITNSNSSLFTAINCSVIILHYTKEPRETAYFYYIVSRLKS